MASMHWLRHLLNRQHPQIPDALWGESIAALPFLRHLSPDDLARLKLLAETLLGSKPINGAGGLRLTDDIAVAIAAQACLPVLNLTLELYWDMPGIIVYPSAFIVSQSRMDEAGVMHEWCEPLAGAAIEAGGAVVLSWEDVSNARLAVPCFNLVIHEFAHKIDMGRGEANGCPPFLAGYHQGLNVRVWQSVFSAAYDDFFHRVEALDRQLPDDFDTDDPAHDARYDALFGTLPMDPYAAEDPAEFFAVASEAFFVLPEPLAADYPQVYRLLSQYYRQQTLP
jgi:Mlc titration factor MtfA (ptsG expression regulator)